MSYRRPALCGLQNQPREAATDVFFVARPIRGGKGPTSKKNFFFPKKKEKNLHIIQNIKKMKIFKKKSK